MDLAPQWKTTGLMLSLLSYPFEPHAFFTLRIIPSSTPADPSAVKVLFALIFGGKFNLDSVGCYPSPRPLPPHLPPPSMRMGAQSRARQMHTAPPRFIITLGLHLTQQKCLSPTPPKPSFVRAPCLCTTPTTQQSTRKIRMQAHRRRFGTVGSSDQRVPLSLPSTAAPPAPSSPPSSPLPSSAQSPADLPRQSVVASAASSSQRASLRITQRLGLARCPREGSSFLQQNACLRPQQLSRNSLLKQQKSPMAQDMMPTTWEALSASRATYRRTWAMQFCWLWAGRQPDAVAQEECGRVRRAHALPFAPNGDNDEDKKQHDLIEEWVVGPAFNFFRMHRFEGVHPPAPASGATSSTTTVNAANSTLIPVFLSAFAPLRQTRCSARLRELPVPPRKPPPLNTATIMLTRIAHDAPVHLSGDNRVDKEMVDENGASANGSDAAEERSIDVDVPGKSTSSLEARWAAAGKSGSGLLQLDNHLDDCDPNQTIDPDILDDTRIHPEDYNVARKLADAQELDEEDLTKQPPSQAISDLLASDNGNGASNGKLTAASLLPKLPLNRSIQS
ncbi:hypothetical protein PCASD_20919 [Puccinia coronata f. sp. avenae]|uniref:HHH domain-containing protein n=1 Tax=Puccinia coronata f. sp. avenae TaxID=200324 RepID=A0A2N5TVW1_9BASI|nr:hypothetical protein PCASD_20919 [Puccinia coronata f. sp. avenae]